MAKEKDKTAPEPGQSMTRDVQRSRILRSAGTVAGITLLSRVAGLVRDQVFAIFFGATLVSDAYVAAFRLPNILRRVVGEGNVAAAFVPVFEHEAKERSEVDLWRLADRFHFAIAGTAAALTGLGILFAPFLVEKVLIPGKPDAWVLASNLMRVTFPYLIFISAAAALMALLNSRDRFAAAAFTPVLFNLTLIGSAGFMVWVGVSIYVWAVAAVLGGFLQWLSLVPHGWRLGMRFQPGGLLKDPAMRRIGALMIPGLFGVGITQFNVLVGQSLASWLSEGNITGLFLAGRLTELPLGVFAISIATVVLPLMSRQAARGNQQEMLLTLNFALRQVALITIPASVGLLILREEIVSVLFQYGAFTAESTAMTSAALGGYSVGLMAFAGIRIVAPGFYAMRDTRTPVKIAAVAMVTNVVGCLGLIPWMGHAGIALANSLAAYINIGLLLAFLRGRAGTFGGGSLLTSYGRLAIASGVMGWVVWGLRSLLMENVGVGSVTRAATLVAIIGIGILTYLAAVVLMRAPELGELRQMRAQRTGA